MVVWGVVWMVTILLVIVSWYIYYILKMAYEENGKNETTESEELLQLPSDRDKQSG
tara:strand:+ start:123 stop:290 length:168 start_codon:yes stop_codon:yes gene_type:complete